MKIALGQIDTTVGDLAGNVGRMAAFARRASDLHADLIAFPELSITDMVPNPGYGRRAVSNPGPGGGCRYRRRFTAKWSRLAQKQVRKLNGPP